MRGRWPGLCWVTFRKSDFPPALIFPRVYAQQSQPPSEKLVTQKCYVPRTERHLSLCWLTVAPQKTPHWLFCPLCTLLPLLTDFWFTPGQDKWGPHLRFRLVICIVSGNLQMDLQGSNSLAKICMREKLSVSCALSVFDLWHLKLLYVINYPHLHLQSHSTWVLLIGSAPSFSLELVWTVSVAEMGNPWRILGLNCISHFGAVLQGKRNHAQLCYRTSPSTVRWLDRSESAEARRHIRPTAGLL